MDRQLLSQQLKAALKSLQVDLVEVVNGDYLHYINLSSRELDEVPELIHQLRAQLDTQSLIASTLVQKCQADVDLCRRLMARRRVVVREWKRFLLGCLGVWRAVSSIRMPDLSAAGVNAVEVAVGEIVDARLLLQAELRASSSLKRSPPFLLAQQSELSRVASEWESVIRSLLLSLAGDTGGGERGDLWRLAAALDPRIVAECFLERVLSDTPESLSDRALMAFIQSCVSDRLLPLLDGGGAWRGGDDAKVLIYHLVVSKLLLDRFSSSSSTTRLSSVASRSFHADYVECERWCRHLVDSKYSSPRLVHVVMVQFLGGRFNLGLFFSIQFKHIITALTHLPPSTIPSSASSSSLALAASLPAADVDLSLFQRFDVAASSLVAVYIPSIAFKYFKLFLQCCLYLDRQLVTAPLSPLDTPQFLLKLLQSLQSARSSMLSLIGDDGGSLEFQDAFIHSFPGLPSGCIKWKESYVSYHTKQCVELARALKNIPILYRRKSNTMVLSDIFSTLFSTKSDAVFDIGSAGDFVHMLDAKGRWALDSWNIEVVDQVSEHLVKISADITTQMDSLKRLRRQGSADADHDAVMALIADNLMEYMRVIVGQYGDRSWKCFDELERTASFMRQ